MNKSIESTEGVFDFPTEYGIKIMGPATSSFEQTISQILEHELADGRHVDYSCKSSTKGNYISVNCTFIADSREQLDQIYAAMKKHDQVLMVL